LSKLSTTKANGGDITSFLLNIQHEKLSGHFQSLVLVGGTNEIYFDQPFVTPFVQTLTEEILPPLVAEEETSTHHKFGLDLATWLSGTAARPAVPMSSLWRTELVKYFILASLLGELSSRLSGADHSVSKGNVSAVVIAASGTFEEFSDNFCKAIERISTPASA
jgi:fatty acid synthase subunit beta